MAGHLRNTYERVALLSDSALDYAQRRVQRLLPHQPLQRGTLYDPGEGIIREAQALPCNDCALRAECDGEGCETFTRYVEGPKKKQAARPRKQAPRPVIDCAHCGQSFVRRRKDMIYCTSKCNKQAHVIRKQQADG